MWQGSSTIPPIPHHPTIPSSHPTLPPSHHPTTSPSHTPFPHCRGREGEGGGEGRRGRGRKVPAQPQRGREVTGRSLMRSPLPLFHTSPPHLTPDPTTQQPLVWSQYLSNRGQRSGSHEYLWVASTPTPAQGRSRENGACVWN